MTAFFEFPVELNGATLKAELYAAMEAAFPGWEPNPNNPETWLIDIIVDRLIVPLAQLSSDVAAELFDRFGEQIVKVQRLEATAATVRSTWTMVDNAGYKIDAGTQVELPTSGNSSEPFRVVADVEVPKGSTTTEAGQVVLEAVNPGAGGNGLSGLGKLVDSLNYVLPEGIALVGESTGGQEAEEPEEFLNRLAETMQTLAPRPIIPADVEILARNIPGVFAAVALDNFNPETDDPEDPETWETERCCSVVVKDAEGEPCSELVKAAVAADLQAKREINFLFFVLDADYTTIAVHYQLVVLPGFAQAAVEANVKAAIESFLAPKNLNVDPSSDPRSWLNRRTLHYQDLVTVVNNQQGVDYFTTLKVGKEGGALGVVDIALAGAAPLTKPGKVEVGA
jgi:hypothetical protein